MRRSACSLQTGRSNRSSTSPVDVQLRPYGRGRPPATGWSSRRRASRRWTGQVAADAEKAGIWVNSADDPANCTFLLPAVHRRGAVTISVSTSGCEPRTGVMAEEAGSRRSRPRNGGARLALRGGPALVREQGRSTESVDWVSDARRTHCLAWPPRARSAEATRHVLCALPLVTMAPRSRDPPGMTSKIGECWRWSP
jgi:hypothetical protein